MTRIAVIIPCHNDGALAQDAVASVCEDEPIEVVVVDDGSTDPDTIERLNALERSGTRVIHRESGGPGAARTAGLAATAAPLVFPLDADDLLEPGALREMADTLERSPSAGFTWGDYAVFGRYEGRYRAPQRLLPWTLTYVNPYPVCSMFRREVLERAGGWKDRAYEDWDLWLRLVGHGVNGVSTERVIYRRRLHRESRQLTNDRRRHQSLYGEIVRRNPEVFAHRDELLRLERPAAWKRVAYPVIFGSRSVVPIGVELLLQRTMLRLGLGLPGR